MPRWARTQARTLLVQTLARSTSRIAQARLERFAIWIAKFRDNADERLQKTLGEQDEAFGFDEAKLAAEACFHDWQFGVLNNGHGDGPVTISSACRNYVRSLRIEGREAAAGFRDWRLKVHGLVQRPLALSLTQLRALAMRSQITMHCCDEGWNAIGGWSGVPVGLLLSLAGTAASARYVVFHCMDRKEEDGQLYYESLDLFDAYHPQTILACDMNGQPLPIEHGAPLRLRVETQIGYKNAKFVDRLEVVDRLTGFGKGRGGWWEDIDNAVWYAGQ